MLNNFREGYDFSVGQRIYATSICIHGCSSSMATSLVKTSNVLIFHVWLKPTSIYLFFFFFAYFFCELIISKAHMASHHIYRISNMGWEVQQLRHFRIVTVHHHPSLILFRFCISTYWCNHNWTVFPSKCRLWNKNDNDAFYFWHKSGEHHNGFVKLCKVLFLKRGMKKQALLSQLCMKNAYKSILFETNYLQLVYLSQWLRLVFLLQDIIPWTQNKHYQGVKKAAQ